MLGFTIFWHLPLPWIAKHCLTAFKDPVLTRFWAKPSGESTSCHTPVPISKISPELAGVREQLSKNRSGRREEKETRGGKAGKSSSLGMGRGKGEWVTTTLSLPPDATTSVALFKCQTWVPGMVHIPQERILFGWYMFILPFLFCSPGTSRWEKRWQWRLDFLVPGLDCFVL